MRIVQTSVLRLIRTGPGVVVSLLIVLSILSLMPGAIALPATLSAVVLVVALGLGRLERRTVRLLARAGPPTLDQLVTWAPVRTELAKNGLHVPPISVRQRPQPTTRAVVRLGQRSLVVTPGLLDALHHRRVTIDEVAALVAHAQGWHHAMRPRGGLATLVVTIPWRAVTRVFAAMVGAMTRLPLAGLAWRLRGVIGVICVVQGTMEGRTWSGALGGLVIALSYVIPAAGRELSGRAMVGADELVVTLGLGGVLAGLWRRLGEPTSPLQLQRLENTTTAEPEPSTRPRLYLVPD